MEELRAEMLELRDVYMEEDVYQLQELRQQLDQAGKTCRILQYRLRKAERRSLRAAQTGHVDGELIHSLEQDVKVSKDISVRLHHELEAVEKQRAKLEEENEALHQRLVETQLAKQVLHNELEKLRELSLKKRGTRSLGKAEKKSSIQEDSADLRCQLHFAKEESALMCRKVTTLARENDSMREELLQYRSLHGELAGPLTARELAEAPHARAAELKAHLQLVEEEATRLSRRVVELEVETRGLRAEADELRAGRGDEDRDGGGEPGGPAAGGESGESAAELRRHLQFVEEEAGLLRRSLAELEGQNQGLARELGRYRAERRPGDEGPPGAEAWREELAAARAQVSELSGKVKKLQYENRVLLSNLQRCDLASGCPAARPALETDAEAGDSAQCVPAPPWAPGPGGDGAADPRLARLLKARGLDGLPGVREQAASVGRAIDGLMAGAGEPDNGEAPGAGEPGGVPLGRLGALRRELDALVRRVDGLADDLKEQLEEPFSDGAPGEDPPGNGFQPPETRSPPAWGPTGSRSREGSHGSSDADPRAELAHGCRTCRAEDGDNYATEIRELQLVLSEAHESLRGLQAQLSQERQLRKEEAEHFNQKILQLKAERHKAALRREFEEQSLSLQRRLEQKFWSQAENLLAAHETQQFRHGLLLLALKLKAFLKRWRQGDALHGDGDPDDLLEVSSVKELYLLLEEEERSPQLTDCVGNAWTLNSPNECAQTLADLKGVLRELCGELGEERRAASDLRQQFAKAKSAWETERTELKCHVAQLEPKAGKGSGERTPPADWKAAQKREREEHQQLLAESYGAVMDLTTRLQRSEKNRARDQGDLLRRLQEERARADQRLRDLQAQLSRLQKEADSWALKRTETETEKEKDGGWKETLSEKDHDKETDAEFQGTNLKRTKSISSVSEFESLLGCSPYLPGQGDPPEEPGPCRGAGGRAPERPVRRSHTAPDKTGIRIYYSPPVARRVGSSAAAAAPPGSRDDRVLAEPGFLFTSARPRGPGEADPLAGSAYGRWLCDFSRQRQLQQQREAAPAPAPAPLGELDLASNLSDDMKEMTNCVRQALRSGSLERPARSVACQTAGRASVATQTARMVSVGLQTEPPRGPLAGRGWAPRGAPLGPGRPKPASPALDRVHARIERPCCPPKAGSPQLRRRSGPRLDGPRERGAAWVPPPPGKQKGSAWARSTTTRDSPVLSGVNDGLSSLFNVVEHGGGPEAGGKAGPADARGRPEPPRYGLVQEFFRSVCGRPPSPPPAAEPAPDAGVRAQAKKASKPGGGEESGAVSPPSGGREGSPRDPDTPPALASEDSVCGCGAQPSASCFSRAPRTPGRPAPSPCRLHPPDAARTTDERPGPCSE
ncbi:LOW QUALITY PROTEIN: protein SOGA1 [Tachyglossus aculeatus]|uniref:LOW QUALITY PROTEIN: protein SOGA1 n=1 Tax=Tachyglossus aculeatus TaxID=9261 RepID=UPI0018F58CBB|nr:LOW QUALITY PROTEIN: protein SOGA1 [Tachyglossus aculeatus]